MSGDPARHPGAGIVPGRVKPVAVAGFAVVVAVGALPGNPSAPAAAAGAVVAAAAAAALVYVGRLPLLAAAVAPPGSPSRVTAWPMASAGSRRACSPAGSRSS